MPTDTARLSLSQPIGADNPAEYRESITQHATVLDNAAIYLAGAMSSLPAATAVAAGTQYYATDVNILFIAVGSGVSATQWIQSQFSPGDIKLTAVSSIPTGWLSCNGSAVSRTVYPFLYSAIGVTYGPGDGSTTFNVPNMIGNVPVGANSAAGFSLGNAVGAATKPILQANLPNVNFSVSDPGHQHVLDRSANGAPTEFAPSGDVAWEIAEGSGSSIGTTNPAATGISVNSGGSGTPLNVYQPSLCLNYIIKV